MAGNTFDDLPETVGQVAQGAPFVLGAEEHRAFERATWLDKAYPEDLPEFPPSLVEGFLLLSMVDAAARLAAPAGDDTMWGLNYGLDRVRFIQPVHLVQTVLSTFETLAVEPKDKGYKVLRRCVFTVVGQDEPAMIADWWSFVLPRGTVERARREPNTSPPERSSE
jgi:acyl dehydratase